jgi:hypothetical protein
MHHSWIAQLDGGSMRRATLITVAALFLALAVASARAQTVEQNTQGPVKKVVTITGPLPPPPPPPPSAPAPPR